MDVVGWNIILFVSKWVFLLLLYLTLFVMLFAVRRELRSQTGTGRLSFGPAPGRLRVIHPGSDRSLKPGRVMALKTDARLGAEADNDLVLRDQFVSGHHARMRWDGSAWWIEDLGSKNGTQVNGSPCFPHMPVQAPLHARISLGDMQLELIDL